MASISARSAGGAKATSSRPSITRASSIQGGGSKMTAMIKLAGTR